MNSGQLNRADRSDGIPGATFYGDRFPSGAEFVPYAMFDLTKRGAQDAYNELFGVLKSGAERAGLEINTLVEGARWVTIYTKAAATPDELDMPMRGFGDDARAAMAK